MSLPKVDILLRLLANLILMILISVLLPSPSDKASQIRTMLEKKTGAYKVWLLKLEKEVEDNLSRQYVGLEKLLL